MTQPLENAYPEFSEAILREIEGILKKQGAAAMNSK